jgi:NAD(P)H-flavin reductase
MAPNLKAKVVKLAPISSVLLLVRLEMVEPVSLEFKSGQFISFILPNNKGLRSYSISSSETDKKYFELTINIFDTSLRGAGVEYIKNFQLDDIVEFKGPYGVLTFDKTKLIQEGNISSNVKRIIFIGTGSGIAPMKSMAEYLNIVYGSTGFPNAIYFGIRTEDEVCYENEFEQIRTQNTAFDYKICLSRPETDLPGADFQGEINTHKVKGHVTEHIIRDINNDTNKEGIYFLLCGKTSTIKGIEDGLLESGIKKENIIYESFG